MRQWHNETIRIVFFGTHDFAATILQGLIDSPLFTVLLVITQPDRALGRKRQLTPPPVKLLATNYDIPIKQPDGLKDFRLQTSDYDLGIVAQYGKIIPKQLLNTPTHGTLNVHTSLLPRYRGASPIQSALIHGETTTGVTIIKMDEGLDTGPILCQKEFAIDKDDTYPDLEKKLAALGRSTLLESIPPYIRGTLKPLPQDETNATTCTQLTREDGNIDWTKTSRDIYNLYRGLTPWPGVWTTWNTKRLKLLKIAMADKYISAGKVLVENTMLYIGCGEKSIAVFKLQLEGKEAMETRVFLSGYADIAHAFFE